MKSKMNSNIFHLFVCAFHFIIYVYVFLKKKIFKKHFLKLNISVNNKTNFEFSHNLDLMHLLSIAALQKALKSFFNISISNKHLDSLLADLLNKNI